MDIFYPRPTDDEAAAAMAAIAAYLQDQESHQTTPTVDGDWHWSASTRLIAQGLQPIRLPIRPAWGRIERLRRAGSGTSGIIGL